MATDVTERLMLDVGITDGMQVIDIGCGSGDLSCLVAARVGTTGTVVGIDRDPQPLQIARQKAKALGIDNVQFFEGDFSTLASQPERFDAVVGRRVLTYQPDAAAALRQLAPALKPGAIVFFQEHESNAVQDITSLLPLHARVRDWIRETVKREGADTSMGTHLAHAFSAAGFTVDGIRAEAGVISPGIAHHAASIVRAMQSRIVTHEVASESDIDIETLERRLREERDTNNITDIWEIIFGVWGRKPE